MSNKQGLPINITILLNIYLENLQLEYYNVKYHHSSLKNEVSITVHIRMFGNGFNY